MINLWFRISPLLDEFFEESFEEWIFSNFLTKLFFFQNLKTQEMQTMLFMPEMGMITMVTNFGLNSPAGAEVVFGVAEAGLANGAQAVGLQLEDHSIELQSLVSKS